jgi:hypothetical protein
MDSGGMMYVPSSRTIGSDIMQYYGYYRNKLEAVTLVLLIEKIYELMR